MTGRLKLLAVGCFVAFAGSSSAGPVVVADPSAFSGADVTDAYAGLTLSRIDVIGEMIEDSSFKGPSSVTMG
jgi:hypothetical protein